MRILKIILAIVGITGAILLFTPFSNEGLLVVFFLYPALLVFVLLIIYREKPHIEIKYRSLLLSVISINTIVSIVHFTLKVNHFPGAVEMLILASSLSIISLAVGVFYFYKNREHQYVLTYELILLFMPAIIILWGLLPANNSPQLKSRYVELISTATVNLEMSNSALSDNCNLPIVDKLQDMKHKIIDVTGGIGDGTLKMRGFYRQDIDFFFDDSKTVLDSLPMSSDLETQFQDATFAGELVYIVTMLQNEIIRENCLQQGARTKC